MNKSLQCNSKQYKPLNLIIMKNENQKKLISLLNACIADCKSCADFCKDMPDMKKCVKLCNDCIAKCQQISTQSNVSGELYQKCVDACNACADECAKHDNSHCKKCAEACRKCAEACHQTV